MDGGGSNQMTLTLEIGPELELALRTNAERAGLPPDQYVLDVLQERLDRDRNLPARLSRAEADLLRRINEGLPPATWERYEVLKGKRDAETLTPDEHRELISLVNTVESWNVRRLQLAAELATLRGVGFPEVVRQLGLGAPADG
jgi:hypothetical protein